MISYAQNAEDVVLARVFSGQQQGFYIDVGACHPLLDSVTHHFYELGWSGINVEPDPDLLALFREARPRDQNIGAAIGKGLSRVDFYPTRIRGHGTVRAERLSEDAPRNAIRVPQMPLADLIDLYGPDDGRIDFLKVDVEGAEFDVIASCDWQRHRPRIVVAEAVDAHGRDSFAEFDAALGSAGYVFGLFDGLNRFYCRSEEAEALLPILRAPANIFDQWQHVREHEAHIGLAAARAEAAHSSAAVKTAETEKQAALADLLVSEAEMDRARAQVAKLARHEEQLGTEVALARHELAVARGQNEDTHARVRHLELEVRELRGRGLIELIAERFKAGATHPGWVHRGDIARDAGNWQEAARAYQRHLKVNPQDAGIWVQLGHAFKESGRLTHGVDAYQRALKLRPDDRDCAMHLEHLRETIARKGAGVPRAQ